jgi:hypothetical protein
MVIPKGLCALLDGKDEASIHTFLEKVGLRLLSQFRTICDYPQVK